jgi:hypothetical protein
MIVNDNSALAKLNSPMNLINRLRKESSALRKESSVRSTAMSLFIPSKTASQKESQTSLKEQSQPQPTETLSDILENHDSQIKLGLAHDKALDLLHRSVDMLATKLDDVSASKLPAVISAAAKTVEGIRRERAEASKNNKDREVHYHFYTPRQNKINDYEVIDVAGL